MPDLLTGRVHLLVAGANVVAPHVAQRKLQGLAVLLNARSPLLPEVPTITEAGLPGLAFYAWSGLFGPARMPRETADRLAREVNAVLNRPEVRGQLERIGFVARGSTPQAMGEHLKTQIESWRKLGKEAGIQPE